MKNKKIPVTSIALFIAAGFMIIYTAWSFINSYKYITEMISLKQLAVKGNVYNITSFYMSNSGQYLFYGISLLALGWIIQRISMVEGLYSSMTISLSNSMKSNVTDEGDDEDFEEWFDKKD